MNFDPSEMLKTHCYAMLWTNHMLKMSRCISCSSSTKYVCLTCKKSTCNKSKDCFVPADEETPGCFKKKTEKGKKPKKEAKALKEDKKQNQLPTGKCLSLCEKVEVIHAPKEQAQSARQLAKRFGCGKTQIAQILVRKETILKEWTSNGTGSHKRNNNEKFEKINHLLWEWYEKARGASIPVDGPLLKEEARLIANNSAKHHSKELMAGLQSGNKGIISPY